jgi:hypothetical protein
MKRATDRKKSVRQNMRSGQAMLIAVLSLGGAILGATTVAGLLTLYQIRATTDTENSAKAIFAADAGTEWVLFNHYCGQANPARCDSDVASGTIEFQQPTFSNGAAATVSCYDGYTASGATTTCSDPGVKAAISVGIANGSERAFFLGVSGSTTTYP